MDSLTQAVLGASIAGACAPKGQRRAALLVGAALGTLPDLDVAIRYGDPVSNLTYHRGFSHSLFVLAPLAFLLWLLLRHWWAPVRESPRRWLAGIMLVLVTHPLLDAHTAYGTQLFWPLASPPVMWSTLFIIDPLYTLPLLVGVLIAVFRPAAARTTAVLCAGLAVSTGYLGWTWVGKTMVTTHARAQLDRIGLTDAPVFSTPTPFNSLLWRVVVLTEQGYLEGYDSLIADERSLKFNAYESDIASMESAADIWAVARLRWFAHDFVKAEVRDGVLILTDLRMGAEPKYVFGHAVAVRDNPHWKAVHPERIPVTITGADVELLLRRLWQN